MDYIEEQQNELEALESIYSGELDVLDRDPCRFVIRIKSEEHVSDSDEGLACSLKITYTPKYPDELPEIEITDTENLTESDEEDITRCVTTYASENIGMAMVFSLVTAAQDWLNSQWDRVKRQREDEAEKRMREVEAEETRKLEGTRVTVESFMAWKRLFDEEIARLKNISNANLSKDRDNKNKVTGKELFMRDTSLNESDLKFYAEGEQVAVDESLFQDLDGISLEDDEEVGGDE